MNLAELKNKARAAAKRVEDRLSTAIGAGRDLTAEEEASNTADEAELAEMNAQIATAEASAPPSAPSAAQQIKLDGTALAATAAEGERTRILALLDLCPTSALSEPLRAAIDGNMSVGDFAISLAQEAKTRGASMDDLRAGTVQEDQLPIAGSVPPKGPPGAKKPGLAQRVAALGHRGLSHLAAG